MTSRAKRSNKNPASGWARSSARRPRLSLQALIQSSAVFDLARAWLADLTLRFRLTDWLEASLGGSVWQDWGADAAGRKQTFSKLVWGIAVPF